jgi:hypothetical protein
MKWSAWLCLSLMLWVAAAESTHQHPSQTEAASCSLCMVAHSTRPTVSSGQTAPVLAAISFLQEEDVVAKAWFDSSAAGIRGPPAL